MADLTPKKLTDIPPVESMTDDTLLAVQQEGSWKKATVEQVNALKKTLAPWQPTLIPGQYLFETAVDIGIGSAPVISNGGKTATGAGMAFSATLEEFLSHDYEAGIAFTMDLASATEEPGPFGVWLFNSNDLNSIGFMAGARVMRENDSLLAAISDGNFQEIPPTATQFLLTVQRDGAGVFIRLFTDVAPSTPLSQVAVEAPPQGLGAFAYYSQLPSSATLLSKNETSFDYVDITDAGFGIDETDLPTQPSGNLYELSLAQDVRLSSLGRVVKDKDIVAFGQDGQPIQIIQEVNIPNIPSPPDLSDFATEDWVSSRGYVTEQVMEQKGYVAESDLAEKVKTIATILPWTAVANAETTPPNFVLLNGVSQNPYISVISGTSKQAFSQSSAFMDGAIAGVEHGFVFKVDKSYPYSTVDGSTMGAAIGIYNGNVEEYEPSNMFWAELSQNASKIAFEYNAGISLGSYTQELLFTISRTSEDGEAHVRIYTDSSPTVPVASFTKMFATNTDLAVIVHTNAWNSYFEIVENSNVNWSSHIPIVNTFSSVDYPQNRENKLYEVTASEPILLTSGMSIETGDIVSFSDAGELVKLPSYKTPQQRPANYQDLSDLRQGSSANITADSAGRLVVNPMGLENLPVGKWVKILLTAMGGDESKRGISIAGSNLTIYGATNYVSGPSTTAISLPVQTLITVYRTDATTFVFDFNAATLGQSPYNPIILNSNHDLNTIKTPGWYVFRSDETPANCFSTAGWTSDPIDILLEVYEGAMFDTGASPQYFPTIVQEVRKGAGYFANIRSTTLPGKTTWGAWTAL